MTDHETSAGATGSHSGLSTLPKFIRKLADGVRIDVAKMPTDGSFGSFVDRLFEQGGYFTDLDYACFQKLLYHPESLRGSVQELRLASDIVLLSSVRRSLYKEVRVIDHGARAEYMFEPVFLEVSYQDPVYGEADAAGLRPVIGYREKTRFDPTRLDIDEFICVMWTRGVRFGIQVQVIQDTIVANKTGRLEVALELAPRPGRDAELQEQFEGLRRDDSPLITAGKADLRRFKNRFPQIGKGQRMMKKIPLQLGDPGFRVTGARVEPEVPRDISLAAIAGPGTRIETGADGQFIVAASSGFISIDLESNQLSVTEKIENKTGVSAKTTGDLTLSVDEFVEHGEVQERRVVEGRHMRFTSTVYGSLVSKSGRIELDDCLSGGHASSAGGSIVIKKRALNASVEAVGGSIDVHYAENSTLIADTVNIGQAVNCNVVAKQLRVGLAQGCTMAALTVSIGTSSTHRGRPSLLSVLVPDTTEARQKLAALKAGVAETERLVDKLSDEMKALGAEPEFTRFLKLNEMVRTGKLTLSPAQEGNLRQMRGRQMGTIKALDKLSKEKQVLLQSLSARQEEISQFKQAQKAEAEGRECSIREVTGETCVQQLHTNLGVPHFVGTSGNDLGKMLREIPSTPRRIFLDDQGSLEWRYAPADPLAH